MAKFYVTFGRSKLMARIGKTPIAIPSGVNINIKKNDVTVAYPFENLSEEFRPLQGHTISGLPVHMERHRSQPVPTISGFPYTSPARPTLPTRTA